jgi:DMSO/TMAO reductase YedYZ heme-binding membrane subunit
MSFMTIIWQKLLNIGNYMIILGIVHQYWSKVKMTFNVYTKNKVHFIVFFPNVDQLLLSMKKNPFDSYHRIM